MYYYNNPLIISKCEIIIKIYPYFMINIKLYIKNILNITKGSLFNNRYNS